MHFLIFSEIIDGNKIIAVNCEVVVADSRK